MRVTRYPVVGSAVCTMILARIVGCLRLREKRDTSPVLVFVECIKVSRIASDCVGVNYFVAEIEVRPSLTDWRVNSVRCITLQSISAQYESSSVILGRFD